MRSMTDQRVAVVTGAGSGLGRLITITLAREGWFAAGSVLPVVADVGDPESVAGLFATIGQRFRRLDLLVNNAGTGAPPGAVDELTPEGWQSIVATNLTGSYLCAHHAVRMMKAQHPRGGRIINNGSISAYTPRPRSIPYTATKHAITGLTKSTALDGRPYGIACGQIDVGNAGTDLTAPMLSGVRQADGTVRPEPVMDVAHVARAVVYMASLPLDANVATMTVMATAMPFVGRG